MKVRYEIFEQTNGLGEKRWLAKRFESYPGPFNGFGLESTYSVGNSAGLDHPYPSREAAESAIAEDMQLRAATTWV